MKSPPSTLALILAIVALALAGYQQSVIRKQAERLNRVEETLADHLEAYEYSERQELEKDAKRAMFAICALGEFAQMERPAGPQQTLTIRSAEFDLFYFTQKYLSYTYAGRPMVELLLSHDENWQQWHMRGEYYSTLEASSRALVAAKSSTIPQIPTDGEARQLLERIDRWLNKHQDSQ